MNRRLKKLILRLLDPLDSAARLVNGKRHLPPLHLRWDVGPLRGFESSAAEFRVYLKMLGGLKPEHAVLDIGCGCGQIALVLKDELGPEGRYVGCDINRQAISWCRRKIAAHDPRFSFHHLDVRNGMYNPRGRQDAAGYRFPPEWGRFDLILLKSVFTHMRLAEIENYISQLGSLLKEGGKCLATFFLLNKHQRELAGRRENVIHFGNASETMACAVPSLPEAIAAYEESAIRDMLQRHHLSVAPPVYYGSWTGDRTRLSHQDILVIHNNGMPG